jgi:penicillin amidase
MLRAMQVPTPLVPSRSRPVLRLALALALAGVGGCHPAACLFPRALPTDEALELESQDSTWPSAPIDIVYDELGIPHAYADNEPDLAYAQGFLHGRDRRSQLVLRRAFAWGTLSELLGADFLDSDRLTRLYTWNIDEEIAALRQRPRVIALLEAYVAGINAGAAEAGASPEELVVGWLAGQLAGVPFEPWTVRDSVAFSRSLSFLLGTGMDEELARTRILARIPAGDPRRSELLQPIGDLGAPGVPSDENVGDATTDPRSLAPVDEPAIAPRPLPISHPSAGPLPQLPKHLRALLLGDLPMGSNAWAVSGEHTESGNPVLSHDPHLTHDGPSIVYLQHLESPEMTAAGVSFAGVPGILLGHGRHIAWGGPVSNVDAKDLVRITPFEGRDDLYILDAEPVPYENVVQRFRIGGGPDAKVVEEVWKVTEFGPVLPPAYAHLYDEGEQYALMWAGFDHPDGIDGTPARHQGTVSFWELAKAENAEQARAALDLMVTNYQTVVFATDQGDIGYVPVGTVPVRTSTAPIGLPRDGRRRTAGWLGRLPGEMKPQLLNPSSGYIVAANQRVVESGGPRDAFIGDEAIHAYRAERIKERLEALIASGPVSVDDVAALQMDVESTAARELSPALGDACPNSVPGYDDALITLICEDLQRWNGQYTLDSRAAVLFRRLERVIRRKILEAHLGEEVALQVQGHHFIRFNIHRRILEAAAGILPALLDDPATAERDGLEGFVAASLPEVIESMLADPNLGPNPDDWAWGRSHTLTVAGALTAIPGGGLFFSEGPTPLDGCGTCVKAEAGQTSALPPESGEAPLNPDAVFAGAVLRLIAELGDPIEVKMVIDTGTSGHFGHPDFYNQFPLWADNAPVQVVRPRAEIEAESSGRVRLLPP